MDGTCGQSWLPLADLIYGHLQSTPFSFLTLSGPPRLSVLHTRPSGCGNRQTDGAGPACNKVLHQQTMMLTAKCSCKAALRGSIAKHCVARAQTEMSMIYHDVYIYIYVWYDITRCNYDVPMVLTVRFVCLQREKRVVTGTQATEAWHGEGTGNVRRNARRLMWFLRNMWIGFSDNTLILVCTVHILRTWWQSMANPWPRSFCPFRDKQRASNIELIFYQEQALQRFYSCKGIKVMRARVRLL